MSGPRHNAAVLGDAFERLRTKNLEIGSFVNIGSGAGDDLAFFRKYYPDMTALMVEMDDRFEPGFRDLDRRFGDVHHVICAAGPFDGDGAFTKSNDVGGALTDAATVTEDATKTRVARIDTLVDEFGLKGPHFLKFDTHGVELDILQGSTETLKNTNLIMMECYNFKLNFVGGKNLTFDEMCAHMRTLGFRIADLCDPLFRPGDSTLWQIHLLFVRDDHHTWSNNSYSA